MSQHQTILLERQINAVRKTEENASTQSGNKADQPDSPQKVAELRDLQAWVLLGEPGAGKSSVFRHEASACDGVHIEIADFLIGKVLEEWKGKCLFLDGLDEYRNPDNNQTVLKQVRLRLIELGRPKFRIACRAADWFGTTDQSDIAGATTQNEIPVFALEPLTQEDITALCQNWLKDTEVEAFLTQANSAGLEALLANPQILRLIAAVYRENGHLPSGRFDAYKSGCERLVMEVNDRTQNDQHWSSNPTDNEALDTAGQIFATLLLGNLAGIATKPRSENGRFATLEKLEISNKDAARKARGSALFLPADQQEQLVPAHRTIAEYLAARWLAAQLNQQKRTLRRLLPLLCGFDGKAVSHLRGLYGWLATHCVNTHRAELIRNDAITVALYGDPTRIDTTNKKLLLTALRQTLKASPAAVSDMWHHDLLGTVLLNDLLDEFTAVLVEPERNDETQHFCNYLLRAANAAFKRPIAHQPKDLSALSQALENVVKDDSRWGGLREKALEAWLHTLQEDKSAALKLLKLIHQNQVSDPEDILIFVLLNDLYPSTLSTADVLTYLRAPKVTDRNAYATFWGYMWHKLIPSQDLLYALQFLVQYPDLPTLLQGDYWMKRMIPSLVNRAIVEHGDVDAVDDETLFEWITLCTDKNGTEFVSRSDVHLIAWWKARPDRYKGVLGVAFARASAAPAPNQGMSLFVSQKALAILNAAKPPDMALWHFEQMKQPHTEWRLRAHLKEAMPSVLHHNEEEGVTLEMLQAWAGNDPDRLSLLEPPQLPQDIQDQRFHDHQKRQHAKNQRSTQLEPLLPAIESGTAHPNLMYRLAQVWVGHGSNNTSDTPIDCFKDYCNNYQAVHDAAKRGFIAYLQRSDLPSPAEIIGNWVHRKTYLFQMGITCMLGADLLWSKKPEAFEALDEVTLERLVSFWWMDTGFSSTRKWNPWLDHLIQNKPELVIRVSVDFVLVQFKIFQASPDLFELRTSTFQPVVHPIAMSALQHLPNRLDSDHLSTLGWLLATALANNSTEKVLAIIQEKINVKELDVVQTVYWLLAGTLLDPPRYENQLLEFVATTWQRLEHLADALRHFHGLIADKRTLPAPTLGRFIELLAPYANFFWPSDGRVHTVTPADNLGDQVRAWVSQLATQVSEENLNELERLRQSPALHNCNGLNDQLQMAHHQLTQQLRQARYQAPTLTEVVSVLTNDTPTNVADLQAFVLDHLDQLARYIQSDPSNPYELFWNHTTSEKTHKDENTCRNALLNLLTPRLKNLSVMITKEANHFNEKRVDFDITLGDRFKLPVEIKGEWHDKLWTAMNEQVRQYTREVMTDHRAIYLVLWFGGKFQGKHPDGGNSPTLPNDLQKRLQAQVSKEAADRVVVRVLDVSWPCQTVDVQT